MSSKERRILRNRASAERSRKNKDIMIDCLRESIQRHETTINELQIAVSAHPMNYLLSLMPRQMEQQASLTSFPFNEPATEEKLMKLENSSVSSIDASDMDSITDESSCSFSSPATSPCNKSQTSGDLISLDMKEIQRKRRQKRVEILRMKRQQRRSNGPSVRSTSADEEISSPRESIDLSNITDPQLLRKLRNRESAARSRQKIIDLIDNLTFQLMERYVTLKDLQDQLTFLDQQNEINSPYTGTMNYSQYPSSHLTMMEVIPWQAMSSSTSTSNSSSPTFEMQLQEREFHLQQQSIPQDIGAVLNGLFVDLPPFNGGFEDIDSLYREMLFV